MSRRTAPKTIRDLVRDLSGEEDVDDAIRAAIPFRSTLLSPDFVLDRASMQSVHRHLHNEDDFAAGKFAEWRYLESDDSWKVVGEHMLVFDVIRNAVLAILTR